jgi:hypothetical protein
MDSVIATLGNKGMRRRLGTESRPPFAVRYSHVCGFQPRIQRKAVCMMGVDIIGGVNMNTQQLILRRLVLKEVGSGQLRLFLGMMKMWRSSHQRE